MCLCVCVVGGAGDEVVVSHGEELNHNTGRKNTSCKEGFPFGMLGENRMSLFGIGIGFKGVYLLLYAANVSCNTNQYLHSCISKQGEQDEISPRRRGTVL